MFLCFGGKQRNQKCVRGDFSDSAIGLEARQVKIVHHRDAEYYSFWQAIANEVWEHYFISNADCQNKTKQMLENLQQEINDLRMDLNCR